MSESCNADRRRGSRTAPPAVGHTDHGTARSTGPQICSPEDLTVLDLVARGWTARRIAEHRLLSPRQVSRHLRAIRTRLGARTNVHAVVLVLRQGLLPEE